MTKRAAASRQDAELSKGPEVTPSEKRASADCCRETELEQNCGRIEGELKRRRTSGNTFTSAPRPHILCSFTLYPSGFCQCLSAALCTHTIALHFLLPPLLQLSPPPNPHTQTHCACLPREDEQYSSGQIGADKATGV